MIKNCVTANPESRSKFLFSPRFSVISSSGPTNLQPSQLSFITEVKSRLEGGAYKLESVRCPCGDGEETDVVISEVDRYGLPLPSVLCQVCGTLRIDPYLDKASLEDFYKRFYQQMYARATDIPSLVSRQRSYGGKIMTLAQGFLKPGSWIYEVGCGTSAALEVFQSEGYQVAGCAIVPS
jgi:hypothetical protein